MPKVTGFNRKRIGHRNYLATIENPPTAEDEYGQTTYASGTWTSAVQSWPCELIDASGGEIVDGMMTKTSTEKVAIGDKPQIDNSNVGKPKLINTSKAGTLKGLSNSSQIWNIIQS